MYGHKYVKESTKEEYFCDIHFHQNMVKLYDNSDIYQLEVTKHENQTIDPKIEKYGLDYWGWMDTDKDYFELVYPSYPQFQICFAYGYHKAEQLGRGKAYRLKVVEIGKVS